VGQNYQGFRNRKIPAMRKPTRLIGIAYNEQVTMILRTRRVFCACIVFMSLAVFGQDYPTRPLRLIVPNPPGGGTDILSRIIATKMSDALNWRIVVDNRPGAGGNIGLDLAAKSAPDGYTIVMGETSNLAINPTLYSKLPYDSIKTFFAGCSHRFGSARARGLDE
jgi:tripartite-type tricarboxylate transporter receptor subunit TctC